MFDEVQGRHEPRPRLAAARLGDPAPTEGPEAAAPFPRRAALSEPPALPTPRGRRSSLRRGLGEALPTARCPRPRQHHAGRRAAVPLWPVLSKPSELRSTPLLPLPARPPQQQGGGQLRRGVSTPARLRAPRRAAAAAAPRAGPEPASGSRDAPHLPESSLSSAWGTQSSGSTSCPASTPARRPGRVSRVSRLRYSPLLLRLQRLAWQWP